MKYLLLTYIEELQRTVSEMYQRLSALLANTIKPIAVAKSLAYALLGLCLFLVAFCSLALYIIKTDTSHEADRFHNHAAVLADDLWAFNNTGIQSYLQLASQLGHYQTLEVIDRNGTSYISIKGTPLNRFDQLLHSINLIGIRTLTNDIVYQGRTLGELHGRQYVLVIYSLFHLFIALLCVALVILFIIYLLSNRQHLERQVLERTKNLRESERRFQDLVNLLPEMVWETDSKGRVTYANRMAIIQLSLIEQAGNPSTWFTKVIPEQQQQARQYFQKTLQGNRQGLQEFTAQASDGQTFPLLIRSAPIYQNDLLTGARCVAIDITERLDLEHRLRQAQRMEAIGLMAGGVAHDLNNILSGIVTFPELLLMDLADDNPIRPAIESIRRSGMAAADIVSDLLTVARGVAAAKTVTNLNHLVEEYLNSPEHFQLQARYPKITLATQLADNPPNISCSPSHIRKCLMNLVINASEAIQELGQITISTTNKTVHPINTGKSPLKSGSYAVLTIRDSGPGIAQKDLDHIFEPFYTKKALGKSGTGLGLTVVWNTVQEHDGMVEVASDQSGTTFTLLFPAVNLEAEQTTQETNGQCDFLGNGELVLVIDDDQRQREIASRLLTSLQYAVATVSSGEEAVEYVKNNSADLLLLDMLMEPGMNGLETYEQILQFHPAQKAIIVSGYSASEDVARTLALGACSFIPKPYTVEQLSTAIFHELNGKT